MLEDETELSPRVRTLVLENPQSVLNLSTEPLKVVVKRATERRDMCTPTGIQVTSFKSYFLLLSVFMYVLIYMFRF
jgi:hypothetical protein